MDPASAVALFTTIVTDVSGPIVMISGLGYLSQRLLRFDIATLNRLSVWVLLPCLIFHTAATTPIGGAAAETALVPVTTGTLAVTLGVTAVQWLGLLLVGWGLALLVGVRRDLAPLIALCVAMPNSGNYAIPLVELAYGPEWRVYQVMIMAGQSTLLMTIGVALLDRGRQRSLGQRVRAVLLSPLLASLVLGFAVNASGAALPRPLAVPIELMGIAMPQIAMFTLGAMLVGINWRAAWLALGGISVLKFVVAPGLTAGLLLAIGLTARLGDLFLLTAATPIANLIAILVADRGRDRDLITAFVFVTTLLSPLVITLALMLTGLGPGLGPGR